jgi:hypothetical protein
MIVVINFKPSKSPLQARFYGGEESLQPNRKNKEMIMVVNFNPNPKQHWEILHMLENPLQARFYGGEESPWM